MNAAPRIKGWCPGALRPMMSGDGLVVRIRPHAGRLDQRQAAGIAELATNCGNGIVDLSNRANVQLRGVATNRYDALIDGLRGLGLIDPDATVESRRNILITPFRTRNDQSETLARDLAAALASPDAPQVSAKFGYAIDTGTEPVLHRAPADIRLEYAANGALILCAADHRFGKCVTIDDAVPQMLELARWSLAQSEQSGTRMSRLLAKDTPPPPGFATPRQLGPPTPAPGTYAAGALVATAFGQINAKTLTALSALGSLRVTPWRMLLVEGATALPDLPDLITDPTDPLLRVVACIGAPGCAQGLAATRPLAREMARHVRPDQTLHVSGCAKGCALPRAADVTLTATPSGFALMRNATADAAPDITDLRATEIPDLLQEVR